MSQAEVPVVPPRPVRAAAAAAQQASRLPEIPPRPVNKHLSDRATSPAHPQSPLYELPNALGRTRSKEPVRSDVLPRTPSVQHLPSVGQEGDEYANIYQDAPRPSAALAGDAAAHTRNVGEDLHLHAPKPSLPKSSATAQVQAVTRTDPSRPPTAGGQDDSDPIQRLRSRQSFSRPGSQSSHGRRSSATYGEEGPLDTGGIRVPINPMLGDVQAPSPAPFGSALTPIHTGPNGTGKRHHHRTPSGRDVYLPPGTYGLHGHGVVPHDRFEKDWYAKHPEDLQTEEEYGHGVYESIGSGRGEYALSSDDLNKIVRQTASRGSGFGTASNVMSYPDEQIGYMASEQYSARPQHTSPNVLTKMQSNNSQPAIESPLRKTSFPADDIDPTSFRKENQSRAAGSDHVVDDTADVTHVDAPKGHYNKVTGGPETMHETDEVRQYASHSTEDGDLINELGYTVPILAADEVEKAEGGEFLQPAVAPRMDRRGSQYDNEYVSGEITPVSRPSSRPVSTHGLQWANHSLSRFTSHQDDSREHIHTPLEDVDEYEPLFPDEDGKKKTTNHLERFKSRPDALRHRFPSQDIWEDTPSSVMYQATVSTPDLPDQDKQLESSSPPSGPTFERPEVEAQRKQEPSEEEKKKLIPKEERWAKSSFAPHLRDDMPTRPGPQTRFPSQDIWEDSPDSHHLVTTVSSPQMEQEAESTSPTERRAIPSIPPRPAGKSRPGDGASSAQATPSVPARPAKHAVPPVNAELSDPQTLSGERQTKETSPTEARKVPSIPDRPKPQVPTRPAKKTSTDTLSKTLSATSVGSTGSTETEKGVTSPALTKAKPAVPARPGSKIASLKGNFMNDLNQKLGLGPPKEKEPEPVVEEEAKPLEDARKGRARGPQRRAPAKSPSTATTTPSFSVFTPKSLWQIDNADGLLQTHHDAQHNPTAALAKPTENMPGAFPESDAVPMSEEKIEQVHQSTVADTSLPPTMDTTERVDQPESDEPLAHVTSADAADVPIEPIAEPTQELSDPIDKFIKESDNGAAVSQHTTASSGAVTGQPLEREASNASTGAVPASKETAHASGTGGALLEPTETKAPEEPMTLRNEQVSAPAPGPTATHPSHVSSTAGTGGSITVKEPSGSANAPVEPMTEGDINYKRLEEMTAKADGKGHAPEESVTRKVVD